MDTFTAQKQHGENKIKFGIQVSDEAVDEKLEKVLLLIVHSRGGIT